MLIVSMILISWGAFAQHDHAHHDNKKEMSKKTEPTFKKKDMGVAYGHYINLKEALVASNIDVAKKAADALEASLDAVSKGEKAKAETTKVSAATTLDAQRKAFSALSNEMATLLKASTLSSGEVYLEYCPMANKNTGGYWLSNQKEIKNPYFGARMLKCGSVKETIH